LGEFAVLLLVAFCSACKTVTTHLPGTVAERQGDEIVAAGKFIHTGTPVVLWMDPGGYDAYRVERRFSPLAESDWESSRARNKNLATPNRYGLRQAVLTPEQSELVRGGGWTSRCCNRSWTSSLFISTRAARAGIVSGRSMTSAI
jgi:hypothetical protein